MPPFIRNLAMKMAYQALRIKWAILRPVMQGVRIMLIRDGQILMVRQTYISGWHFPGGLVDRGETLQEAAMREAREETGVVCNDMPQLFGVFTNFVESKSDHIAVFLAEDFEVHPSPDRWEIAEIGWFPVDDLPEDASKGSKRRMVEYLAGEMGIAGRW